MNHLQEMLDAAESAGHLTLHDIRQAIQRTGIDTDLATLTAAQIEKQFLNEEDRAMKIAVFLSGLIANLISE